MREPVLNRKRPAPVYDRDGITLYQGDCLDVLPMLGQVDHVITDPPYEAEAHTMARRRPVAGTRRAGDEHKGWRGRGGDVRVVALPFDAITEDVRSAAAVEIARLVRRWSLVFCQAEAAHKWESELMAAGMSRRRWCVWIKPDGQPQFTGDRPGMGYETIVATHAVGKSRWNGGGKLGVFRHVKNVTGSQFSEPHPTRKPIALMRELIELFTDPGETILDPFAGSGTTLVAARDLGRKAIGIELSAEYAATAVSILEHGVKGAALVKRGQEPLFIHE